MQNHSFPLDERRFPSQKRQTPINPQTEHSGSVEANPAQFQGRGEAPCSLRRFPPPFCAITRISQRLREFGIRARLCSAGAEHTQLPAHADHSRRDTAPSRAELLKRWEKPFSPLFLGYSSLWDEPRNPIRDVGFVWQIALVNSE